LAATFLKLSLTSGIRVSSLGAEVVVDELATDHEQGEAGHGLQPRDPVDQLRADQREAEKAQRGQEHATGKDRQATLRWHRAGDRRDRERVVELKGDVGERDRRDRKQDGTGHPKPPLESSPSRGLAANHVRRGPGRSAPAQASTPSCCSRSSSSRCARSRWRFRAIATRSGRRRSTRSRSHSTARGKETPTRSWSSRRSTGPATGTARSTPRCRAASRSSTAARIHTDQPTRCAPLPPPRISAAFLKTHLELTPFPASTL